MDETTQSPAPAVDAGSADASAEAPPPEGSEEEGGGYFDQPQTVATVLRQARKRRSADYLLDGLDEMLASGAFAARPVLSRLAPLGERTKAALKADFKGDIPRLWAIASDGTQSFLDRLSGCDDAGEGDEVRERVQRNAEERSAIDEEVREEAAEVLDLMKLLGGEPTSSEMPPATAGTARTASRRQAAGPTGLEATQPGTAPNGATNPGGPPALRGARPSTAPVAPKVKPQLEAVPDNQNLRMAESYVAQFKREVAPALASVNQAWQKSAPAIDGAIDWVAKTLANMRTQVGGPSSIGFDVPSLKKAVAGVPQALQHVDDTISQMEKGLGVLARRRRTAGMGPEVLPKIWAMLDRVRRDLGSNLKELAHVDPEAFDRVVSDIDQMVGDLDNTSRQVADHLDKHDQQAYSEVASPGFEHAAGRRATAAFGHEDDDDEGVPLPPKEGEEEEDEGDPIATPGAELPPEDGMGAGEEPGGLPFEDPAMGDEGNEPLPEGPMGDEPPVEIEPPSLPDEGLSMDAGPDATMDGAPGGMPLVEIEFGGPAEPIDPISELMSMMPVEEEQVDLEQRAADNARERDELAHMLEERAERVMDVARELGSRAAVRRGANPVVATRSLARRVSSIVSAVRR